MRNLISFLSFLLIFSSIGVYAWDSDDDNIPNKYDECKKEPEDYDDFQDTDGCPEPDNDQDGICDPWVAKKGQSAKWAKDCKGSDKCPNTPEDRDGFQDEDGCPDKDNDQDGIPDDRDKCPMEPEDFDTFEDTDGCPEPDNDSDGVLDAMDKCPLAPEDKDGFEDEDGCPDFDNDGDGIKDEADKCPNEAETINQMEDDDGCPDLGVLPIPERESYPHVDFRTGTDELVFESFNSLDSLAQKLTIFKTKKIRVFLFRKFAISDSVSLSILAKQQDAIIRYLTSKGANEDQIVPIPYTLEYYESVKGSQWDPNQSKPVEILLVGSASGTSGAANEAPQPDDTEAGSENSDPVGSPSPAETGSPSTPDTSSDPKGGSAVDTSSQKK